MDQMAAGERELADLFEEAESEVRRAATGRETREPSPAESALERFRREYAKRVAAVAAGNIRASSAS